MKKKIIEVKPGSVLMYKDYSWPKRMWAKMTKKNLPYNRYFFPAVAQEIMVKDNEDMVIYEPMKKYNKKETEKLLNICWDYSEDIKEIILIINEIRPNTIDTENPDFESNKYYKTIDVTQKAGEICY